MAEVELSLSGSGTVGEISSWTITENGSPISAAEPSGAIDNIDISAASNVSSKFIIDNTATFVHSELGSVSGRVDSVSPLTTTAASFDIAGILEVLNIDVTAPATGQLALSDVFSFYAGLASSNIFIDWQASSNPLRTYGGWTGNLWTKFKELAAVNRVEFSVVSGAIQFRDWGSTTISIDDNMSISRSFSSRGVGQFLEIVNQNTQLVSNVGGTKYNYSQNPSLETNSTGWSSSASGVTTSVGRVAANATNGTYSYKSEVSSVDVSGKVSHSVVHSIDISSIADGAPISASIGIQATLYVETLTPTLGAMPIYVTVDMDGSSSAVLPIWSTSLPRYVADGTLSGLRTYSLTGTLSGITKSIGATTLRIYVVSEGWPNYPYFSGPAVQDKLNADAALLTNGSLVPYFDGNSGGASWAGTTNNSISSKSTGSAVAFYDALQDGLTLSVDIGQKVVNYIQTDHFPDYLAQPTVSPSYPIGVGTYYVIDSQNLQVSASDWASAGGGLSVAIGETPGVIEVTLTGPITAIPGFTGPYYLAYFDGATKIPTLSIAGTGVKTFPETVRILTGADPEKISNVIARTVDSQFVTDAQTMYDVAAWALPSLAGPSSSITVTMGTHQIAGLGLTVGSTFIYDEAGYRVSNCRISGATATLTCDWFTEMSDSEALWSGSDAGTYDEFWSDYDSQDQFIAPLRFYNTSNNDGDWLFPAEDIYPSAGVYPGIQD